MISYLWAPGPARSSHGSSAASALFRVTFRNLSTMPSDTTATQAAIDAQLEANDLDGARGALSQVDAQDETYAVLRIKLALYDGSLPAGAAMQKLIALMRRDASWPGARELYQEASNLAYQSRQSSVSHSHPPPPVRERNGDDTE
jgi:hypothetical protein